MTVRKHFHTATSVAPFNRQWVRFLVVGVGANLLLFVLTFLLGTVGVPAFAAGAGGYAIVFVAAYAAQRDWTFRRTAGNRRTLPRYLVAQILCAAAAGAVGHLCVHLAGMPQLVTSVAVVATAAVSSYVLSSRWVFAVSDVDGPTGQVNRCRRRAGPASR